MASTNKTTHYELSQFIGTDKPAWLGDYNSDMSKIDTGINTAQTTATGAEGKADANTTAIGTIASLTTDVKTDLVSAINEVDGHADTAQSTATDAYSLASSTNSNLNTFIGRFAFTDTDYNITTTNDRSISNNATFSASATDNLKISVNNDGSLFKCTGFQQVTVSTTGQVTITLPNAGIVATSSYDILSAGFAVNGDGTNIREVLPVKLTVSNGQIEVKFNGGKTGLWYVCVSPCLYINGSVTA